MNILIADDEPLAQQTLKFIIESYHRSYSVVAVCANADEVLHSLARKKVDIILLDIEMPGKSGIQLAAEIQDLNLHVIFITAHDEYALRAFRLSAIDYLLKPVDPQELANALEKCRSFAKGFYKQQWSLYQQSLHGVQEQIALPTRTGLEVCKLSEIVFLKGDESYTHVVFLNKSEILVSRKLGEMEEQLAIFNFLRVHKSFIINLIHVKRYIKGEGGYVEMVNGQSIDVSRRKKMELLDKLHRL